MTPRSASAQRPLEMAKTRCSSCNLKELCLPFGLTREELCRLDGLVSARKRIRHGDPLYHTDQPFDAIYAVRSGFFKTVLFNEDGREQVTGLHMSGELMGLDGIGNSIHRCSAVALEDSEVCVIPFAHLENLSREISGLQHYFHQVMSREIVRDHGIMLLLGTMRAEERLAAFLLNLSQRFTARGYSADDFNLRMNREEIGSYLGMKLETVSRTFSRFQEFGLIAVHHKHIRILDIPGLNRLLTHLPQRTP